MKIAIIGGGYAGVATCWHLLQQDPRINITLYDSVGIGGAASAAAAGLLHSFGGLDAKLSWMGREGLDAAKQLLDVASEATSSVYEKTGILRIALNERQSHSFSTRALEHSDVRWCEAEECQEMVPGLVRAPGIFITSGITVQSETYVKALWKACENAGANFQRATISNLDTLTDYDTVVLATGAGTKNLMGHLRLNAVKGQILELEWPTAIPPLQFPVNSQAYIIMKDTRSCIVGATFEKTFMTALPDLTVSEAELRPKIEALLPALKDAKIISCRAGLRATTPNHLPLVERINKNTWVFTGLGSKGLLYHALLAKKLAEEITSTST